MILYGFKQGIALPMYVHQTCWFSQAVPKWTATSLLLQLQEPCNWRQAAETSLWNAQKKKLGTEVSSWITWITWPYMTRLLGIPALFEPHEGVWTHLLCAWETQSHQGLAVAKKHRLRTKQLRKQTNWTLKVYRFGMIMMILKSLYVFSFSLPLGLLYFEASWAPPPLASQLLFWESPSAQSVKLIAQRICERMVIVCDCD